MSELPAGTVIAGCRVDAVAGRGGMGVVYRATELGLGRPVALKLIAPELAADEGFRERFAREARLTASLDHPNVIPVYAAGEEGGRLYLTMRYVAGTDLAALLAADGPLAPARAAAIVTQVAAALDAAHAAGLVHRDVKPANVLIGSGAGSEHVYLSDFGIVRAPAGDSRLTDSGEWVGTVDFMAPEQLKGERTDARTDVYGLGCVLYAALTSAVPFPRDTAPATMLAHMTDPPPRPSVRAPVPEALDAVVERAMAKDPQARFPSAGDLARATVAASAGRAGEEPERSVARGPAAPDDGAPERTPAAEPAVPAPPDPSVAATAHADRAEASTALVPPTASRAATEHAAPSRAATALRPDPAIAPAGGGAPPPSPTARRAPAARRRSGGRLAVLLGAVAVVAALGIAALGGAFSGSGSDDSPLGTSDVRRVVGAFARAYGGEDLAALGRTLSPGVRRVAPGSAQLGRVAVLAEYRRQFAANAVRGYRISSLAVRGGAVGRAEGGYTVPRSGGAPIAGRIVFGVARVGGRPRIALIAAEPRA